MKNYLIAPENYYIKPMDIDAEKSFIGAFNKLGKEVLAQAIVRCCQMDGYWKSFNILELIPICEQVGANPVFVEHLRREELIIIDRQERYCVTTEFVKKCYKARPKK